MPLHHSTALHNLHSRRIPSASAASVDARTSHGSLSFRREIGQYLIGLYNHILNCRNSRGVPRWRVTCAHLAVAVLFTVISSLEP